MWRNQERPAERLVRPGVFVATHSKEEAKMKRTLIALALVAAAGTAGAQTVTTPPGRRCHVTPPSAGSAV